MEGEHHFWYAVLFLTDISSILSLFSSLVGKTKFFCSLSSYGKLFFSVQPYLLTESLLSLDDLDNLRYFYKWGKKKVYLYTFYI